MQTKLVATSIVAAILCSCLLVYDGDGPVSTLGSNHLSEYSESTSLGEFKIHKPGESYDSEETLVWYPNNITGLSTMQFTILLDNALPTDAIDGIKIAGNWTVDSQQSIEQFSTEITEFEIINYDEDIMIIENYTYPSTVWGGNYSIVVEISFSNLDTLSLERNDVKFNTYGFNFGVNSGTTPYICSCEWKAFDISLTSTGEEETEISFSVTINDDYDKVKVRIAEDSEENSTGSLIAGDSQVLVLEVIGRSSSLSRNEIVDIPIFVEAFFENDEGELIYLLNGNIDFTVINLEETAYPNVELSFEGFNHSLEYIDGNPPKIRGDFNTELFTYQYNFFEFFITITNPGYYGRFIEIDVANPSFDYRISDATSNLTVDDFNERRTIIESTASNQYVISIENIYPYDLESIGFNIGFNDSLTSFVRFDIRQQPKITDSVFNYNLINQEITELPITITEFVDINLAEYEDHLFFDNEWNLLCTTAGLVAVEIPIFASPCLGDPIQINYAEDSSKLSSIEIEVNVDESYIGESVIIELDLQPMILPITTAPLHTLIVEIPINIQDNDNDGNTQTGNNNSTNTDDSNNTDNSNNTTDDDNNNVVNNQTNFDIDNDGIPNLVDDCPDTKPGDTVDEFGCTIIDTDTDDDQQNNAEQQQNSDNPASKSDETNVLLYVVIGLIIVAIIGGVLVIRNRSSAKPNNSAISTVASPVMPLPVMPLAPLEPVVLQQWTDANGYSWRQMSDQTIMWWNGTDWIPYGKN